MKIIATLTFNFFILTTAFTQDALKITPVEGQKRHYKVDGKIYAFSEMESIFQANPKALSHYEKAELMRWNTKMAGYFSLGSAALVATAVVLGEDKRTFFPFNIYYVWALAVPVAGTLALVNLSRERNQRTKAINLINQGEPIGLEFSRETLQLELGVSAGGFGVAMRF